MFLYLMCWAELFALIVFSGICILSIHVMIQTNLQYLPESIVVIFLGALIGLFLKLLSEGIADFGNWQVLYLIRIYIF